MKYSVRTVIKQSNNIETIIDYKTDDIEEALKNINTDDNIKKENLCENNIILEKIKDGLFQYFETPTICVVLVYLCPLMEKDNSATTSLRKLTENLGIAKSTAYRSMAILQELNFIETIEQNSKGTKYNIIIENLKNLKLNTKFDAKKYFIEQVSNYIYKNVKRASFGKSCKNYKDILGLDGYEFAEYIQNQFVDGMSWSNRLEWHIDHIIPISSAKNLEEAEKLNHYTNLRPLLVKDNLLKSDKLDYELIEES